MLRLARKTKHPAAGHRRDHHQGTLLGLMIDKQEVHQTWSGSRCARPARPTACSIEDWKKQFAPKLDLPVAAEPADDDEDAA